jgi:hypothetical protein
LCHYIADGRQRLVDPCIVDVQMRHQSQLPRAGHEHAARREA